MRNHSGSSEIKMSGEISLYHNDILIQKLNWSSRYNRKKIIERWRKTYNAKNKNVYIYISHNQKNKRMKHLLNLSAEQYSAVESGRPFIMIKSKRIFKEGDELICESDGSAQIIKTVSDVTTSPGLMKGWAILTFKQAGNES